MRTVQALQEGYSWRRFAGGIALGGLALIALGQSADGADTTAVTARIRKGVLTVTGTAAPDAITLRLKSGDANTLEIDVGADGTADFAFDRPRFGTIVVEGRAGGDTIAASSLFGAFTDTELTTLSGEGGNDVLFGATGPERLTGGAGDDFVDGNQGVDTLAGGDGADVFQWDPGDGSDTLTGGTATDRLVFNGSAANERLALTQTAGHVHLTRDIATITLDLDDIETIDLRTLGGSDTITVNDLTGTDTTTIDTDLAATGGGDDTMIDEVVVPPGSIVTQDATAAVVDGLGAKVRVRNGAVNDRIHVTGTLAADSLSVIGTANIDNVSAVADGTDVTLFGATPGLHLRLTAIEQLDIDLAAGNDQFSAVGNLATLTTLNIDGGADNDTILGSNGTDTLTGGAGDDFVDGQQGVDTLAGGDGADVFQWDPGDGSDTLTGGTATDRLVFNGSAANERLALTQTAGHVHLTRDIATITLDLDDIETIDLRTLGGSDTITVNDLTGTDTTTIDTDLAATGGGDDTMIDEVVVPPGSIVTQDATAAVVDGLGAKVRVRNGAVNDRIHVTGTLAADSLSVIGTANIDNVSAVADGTDVTLFGATPGLHLRLTAIEQLDIDLAAGNDQFSAVGNLATLTTLNIDGGADNDTILGSNGADTLTGGAGDDFVDGQQGVDTLAGGDGADVFQWDPGDGSDTLTGGTATDRLVFNGSAANERLALTQTAGHVHLTRDIATITLDLDDIETIDLRTLGGSDTITVNDLTGTDTTTIDTDLAATGGAAADSSADEVIVNGTSGDDTVAAADDGSEVVVDGLAAAIRIAQADPTLDRLTVNGLEGADSITATPGASALIVVNAQP